MNRLIIKRSNQARRKHKVRTKLSAKTGRLRLSVAITSKHVSAQIIDDNAGKTLVASSSTKGSKNGNLTEMSQTVGGDIAKKAKAKKIKAVKFDRGSKLYHGRIKAFADAARDGGLKF